MKLLFKVSGNEKDDSIVKDTNFTEHYPAIHKQFDWKSLKPYIRQAVNTFVIPFIGQDLYDEYADEFNGANSFSGDKAVVLEKLQDVCAYYSMLQAVPMNNAIMGDLGVQETSSANGTTMPVSQWRYKNLLLEICNKADELMDDLLNYLEMAVRKGSDDFNNWKNHDVYKSIQSDFFRSTTQLNGVLDIGNSRRTFSSLIFYLRNAERRHLKPILGQEYYDELKGEIKGDPDSIGDLTNEIIRLSRVIVSSRAVDEGAPRLTLKPSSSGFLVRSGSDGMETRTNMANKSHLEAIESMRYQARRDAEKAESDLENLLYQNIDKSELSTWRGSNTPADAVDQTSMITKSANGIGGGGML